MQFLNKPGQNPQQTSPDMSGLMMNSQVVQQPGQNGNVDQQAIPSQVLVLGFPPLPRGYFGATYKAWCGHHGITHDQRLMSIENRPIDLYALHSVVMIAGGAQRVTMLDQWSVIGAKLGFVQFPGSETEPARSGPGVAQHLQHAYREYLFAFDDAYMRNLHPTTEGLQQTMSFVTRMRKRYEQQFCAQSMTFATIPPEQMMEYNKDFEQLYRFVMEIDQKLHIVALHMKEVGFRCLVAIVMTTHHARSMLSSNPPRYTLDLATVRSMTKQLLAASNAFVNYMQSAVQGGPSSAPETLRQHPAAAAALQQRQSAGVVNNPQPTQNLTMQSHGLQQYNGPFEPLAIDALLGSMTLSD